MGRTQAESGKSVGDGDSAVIPLAGTAGTGTALRREVATQEVSMMIWRPLAIVVALAMTTALAWAQPAARGGNNTPLPRQRATASAPEIDPAVVGGAIALLTGGMFLVARRTRRNNK
jgi:hypothetical protein